MARHVLDASIFQTLLGMGPITGVRHYSITIGLWLLSLILALSTKDLGDILEIFGAFGASVSCSGSNGEDRARPRGSYVEPNLVGGGLPARRDRNSQ